MFNAIVIFSKDLSEEEIQRIQDLTSAESIVPFDIDAFKLHEFARIVLGIEDFEEIAVFRMVGFLSLSFLIASELQPLMFLQDEDGVLETIQKYGEIASMAEHAVRPFDVFRNCAMLVVEGKMKLGLPLNERIVKILADNPRPEFEQELQDIIRYGRDYYSAASRVEV